MDQLLTKGPIIAGLFVDKFKVISFNIVNWYIKFCADGGGDTLG